MSIDGLQAQVYTSHDKEMLHAVLNNLTLLDVVASKFDCRTCLGHCGVAVQRLPPPRGCGLLVVRTYWKGRCTDVCGTTVTIHVEPNLKKY